MKKKTLLSALIALVGIFTIAGCKSDPAESSIPSSAESSTSSESSTSTGSSTTSESSTSTGSSTTSESSTTESSTASETENPDTIHEISTADQLVEFMQSSTVDGKYKLTADIDLSEKELVAPTIVFSGEFDGNGHVIKNASITTTTAKVGVLFAQIINGTVSNLTFRSCHITGSSESVAIMTGLCEGGTFTNIEFSNCSATTSNNYVGLLYARNTKAGNIVINGLTIKNSSSTSCTQYGGFVAGDIIVGSTFTIKNAHLEGEFKKSSGNGSFIVGRNRGANVVCENVVADAVLPSSQTGVFSSGNDTNTVSLKNCVVLKASNTSAPFKGKGKETITYENVYSVVTPEVQGPVSVAVADITPTWYLSTLNLDNELWEAEDDSIKLKYASSNKPSADATITEIEVSASGAKTIFYTGDEFSTDGLAVIAKYSDGVQVMLAATQYTVDDSQVDLTTAGKYTVTVKIPNTEISDTYDIMVRMETGLAINYEFAKTVYLLGDAFLTSNIYGYATLSDDTTLLLDSSKFTIDASAYKANEAGTYTITVKYKNFEAKTFTVTVVEGVVNPIAEKIAIAVDSSSTLAEGSLVKGYPTFTTIAGAMDYINSCKYEASIEKVVYIMDGTYEEKVTVSAPNVTFIGESKTGTIITTKLIEDSEDPTGKKYGLDCATLTIAGEGFTATNMSIRNDFDYINDASKYGSPQGLALTINADKATLFNVVLYGNQDTLYLKKGRTYVKDSLITGNVDFIFGNASGIGFFDTCEIRQLKRGENQKNGGYITAMKATAADKPTYGYVFYKCNLTAEEGVLDGSVGLGRTWGDKATTAYIECVMGKHIATAAYKNTDSLQPRWNEMNGYSPADADFAEYGSTGEGAIEAAVAGGSFLTQEQAKNYTIANVLAITNGNQTFTGEFNPTSKVTSVNGYLTTTNDYAVSVDATAEMTLGDDPITIDLTISVFNPIDKTTTWTSSDETVATVLNGKVTALKSGSVTITVNVGGKEASCVVTIAAPTGTYTVKFVDGETEISSVSGTKADTITVPTAPMKDGANFLRYYLDAKFTKPYNLTTFPEKNVTVYARYWTIDAAVTQISTATELMTWLSTPTTNAVLVADIDCTEITNYAGSTIQTNKSLDGLGYTISNLSAVATQNSTGLLFGEIYANKVSDLILKNCSLSDGGSPLQFLALISGKSIYSSSVIDMVTFDNCTMDTAASSNVALLAAQTNSNTPDVLTLKNITVKGGIVKGTQYVSAILSAHQKAEVSIDGLILDNFNNSGVKNSGPVVGKLAAKITITNSDMTATITGLSGAQYNGGVIGYSETTGEVVLTNSKVNLTFDGTPKNTGGVIGRTKNGSKITVMNSEINITATASQNFGGIAGQVDAGTILTVTDVKISGSISADYYLGAIVGQLYTAAGQTSSVTISGIEVSNFTITMTNNGTQYADIFGYLTPGTTELPQLDIDFAAAISYDSSSVTLTAAGIPYTPTQGTARIAE